MMGKRLHSGQLYSKAGWKSRAAVHSIYLKRPTAPCSASGNARRSDILKFSLQKKLLQCAVAFFGLIPIIAGGTGVFMGVGMLGLGSTGNISFDNHFSYLSGLLLGIGLAFYSCIPRIETKTARFQLLTAIVFIGGLARLTSLILLGSPSWQMLGGLLMELMITPLLCFWQSRLQVRHHQ